MTLPRAVSRIKALCGDDVRFVVMLRDPVERAQSLSTMRYRLGTWKVKQCRQLSTCAKCGDPKKPNLDEVILNNIVNRSVLVPALAVCYSCASRVRRRSARPVHEATGNISLQLCTA